MPTYSFTHPVEAVGLWATALDALGNTVATAQLIEAGAMAVVSFDLPSGSYRCRVDGIDVELSSVVLDDEARVVPGASETAYFVATGPTFASDYEGGELTIEADTREGDLPSWASVVNGQVVLDPTAGTCALSFNGKTIFDFTATTPQTDTGTVGSGFRVHADGVQQGSTLLDFTDGDSQNVQETPGGRLGEVFVASVVSVEAYPGADDVLDGVVTPSAALTITRLAPAPVLPE